MKVLVVDDNVVARRVLEAFLKQSNYEMEIVEDGLSALRVLTSPDAPPVAIIDWMMPDLSGLELCARVRQQDAAFQPYLIILSGRKEKVDAVAALDAGADDFVTKPFNIQELQARLRVAERSVERQLALQRKIAALEEKLARASERQENSTTPETSCVVETPTAAELRPTGVAALEPHQIDTVVAGALRHCGLNYAPRRIASPPKSAPVVGWASLLLLKEESWVDLLLSVDHAGLVALWSKGRDRPAPPPTELATFARTLQNSLCESLRSVLRAMGSELLAPLAAQSISPGDPPLLPGDEFVQRYHYKVGGATLTFSLVTQPSPLQEKTTAQLQLFDILAKPYPPTEQVPLLRGGVTLKAQLIEKLRLFAAQAADAPAVPVHRPSSLALEYHR